MDIDDKDFYVVRKNLNVISVLILVLAFTNAKVNNNLSILGVEIEIDGTKLYIALFILYSYFVWRYLTKLPLLGGFWNGFMQYYMSAGDGVIQEHNFDRYRESFFEKSSELRNQLEYDSDIQPIDQKIIRLSGKSYLNLRLAPTFQRREKDASGKTVLSNQNLNIYHDFKVSRFYFLRKFILFCTKREEFGDYLFPLLLVLINLCFFFFSKDWQGSISKLF